MKIMYLCEKCDVPMICRNKTEGTWECPSCGRRVFIGEEVPRRSFLFRRAEMNMKDRNFPVADQNYIEVLALDDADAEAYWGRLKCEYEALNQEEFEAKGKPLAESRFFHPILKYGDEELRQEVISCNKRIVYQRIDEKERPLLKKKRLLNKKQKSLNKALRVLDRRQSYKETRKKILINIYTICMVAIILLIMSNGGNPLNSMAIPFSLLIAGIGVVAYYASGYIAKLVIQDPTNDLVRGAELHRHTKEKEIQELEAEIHSLEQDILDLKKLMEIPQMEF